MIEPKFSCHGQPEQYSVLSNAKLPWRDGWYLNWHAYNLTPDMDKHQTLGIIHRAYQNWNRHLAPLEIMQTREPKNVDFKVYFVSADDMVYVDGEKPFKAPMGARFKSRPGVLAVHYTYAKGSANSLCCYINDAYFFGEAHAGRTYALEQILTHEIFHGLGGGHSSQKQSINFPSYNPKGIITFDDVDLLMALHGFDRLRAVKKIYSSNWVYRNSLIKAGRDPDNPSRPFKFLEGEPIALPPKDSKGCVGKLLGL